MLTFTFTMVIKPMPQNIKGLEIKYEKHTGHVVVVQCMMEKRE